MERYRYACAVRRPATLPSACLSEFTIGYADVCAHAAGLEHAKQALYEAVILPALRPDLFSGLLAPVKGAARGRCTCCRRIRQLTRMSPASP